MATTFGYSCRNSRSNGSGTRWLIALNGARVTVGRQACICSIYQTSTAGRMDVTRGKSRDPKRHYRRPVAGGPNRIYKVAAPGAVARLFALPGWLALFGEGGEPLLGVRRLEETDDAAPLQRQRTLERHLEALLRDQLDLADSDRGSARQRTGEGNRLRQQPVRSDQAIDDAEAGRRLRVQRLTRQEQFHRLLPPDQARQALGPTVARQQAERDFRDTQPVFALRRKAEISSERDLQTAAQAVAADGGDEHLWRVLHLQ